MFCPTAETGPAARRFFALSTAILLALSASGADARPRTLDREEIVQLLTGNSVLGFDPRTDSEFTMFHSSGGRIRAELRNVNRQSDESDGRWWVSDEGKLCVEWSNYRWISSCAGVVLDDEAITFVDDNGRIISFGEVVPGNPDDL